MTVGERMTARRAALGLTAEELGAACGVSGAALLRCEAGEAELRRTIAMKLAVRLGVTLAWLMGWPEGLPEAAMPAEGFVQIPVLGIIRAGLPITAEEQVIGYEAADVESAEGRFYLLVQGDSMIGAGIHDGCRVLFNTSIIPENGDIVACLVGGGDATVKRYLETENGILLCPENPAYDPISLSRRDFEAGWARILGVAEEVVHRLR